MKLQDMPVLDRMYPGAVFQIPGEHELHARNVTPDFFRNLAEVKRFKLDDDLRVPTPKGVWEPAKIFGHLVLPFPKVWIEWENKRDGGPPLWMAAVCVHASEYDRFFFEMFGARPRPDREIPQSPMRKRMLDNSWAMFMFEITTGIPRLIPGIINVEVDEDGIFQGVLSSSVAGYGETFEEQTATLVDFGWDALAAIGWLNCRNVTTEEHDRSNNVKRRRRPNRDKAATLSFNTIKLPGLEEARSGGRPGEKTDTVAMHMARGHFKTFTEEAPLFGKYTGTYWWGWQVRGNRKNGITVSDYKMEGQMSA